MLFEEAPRLRLTIVVILYISALCDFSAFGAENNGVIRKNNNGNDLMSPRFIFTEPIFIHKKNGQRLDKEDNQSGLHKFKNEEMKKKDINAQKNTIDSNKIVIADWIKTKSKKGKLRVARQTNSGSSYTSLYPKLPTIQPYGQYQPYNANPYQPGYNPYDPSQVPPFNSQYPGYNPAHSSNPPFNSTNRNISHNVQYPFNPPYSPTTQRPPYGVMYPAYYPTQSPPIPSSHYPSLNHSQGYYPSQYPSQYPTMQRSPYAPPYGQYPTYNPTNSSNWQSSFPNLPYNTTVHSQYPYNPSYPSHDPTGLRPPYNQAPSQYPAYNSNNSHSVGILSSNYTNPHGRYY